jgi:hypothetical protein
MIRLYAIVENSNVTNIINIDDADTAIIAALRAIEIPVDCKTFIGATYSNGVFEQLTDWSALEEDEQTQLELTYEEIELLLQEIINENFTKP